MFEGKRYVTPGVIALLSVEMQMFLWNLIERMKPEVELDYLQIFELKPGKNSGQTIRHFQEIPRLEKEYVFDNVANPLTARLFIIAIDEDGQSIMMLPEER